MISEKLQNSIRDCLDDGWTKTEMLSALRHRIGLGPGQDVVDECAAFIDSITDANERDIKEQAQRIMSDALERADNPCLTAEERQR